MSDSWLFFFFFAKSSMMSSYGSCLPVSWLLLIVARSVRLTCPMGDPRSDSISFRFEKILSADATVTGIVQVVLRETRRLGYSTSKCLLWMKGRHSRAVLSPEGKPGRFLTSTASSFPSLSIISTALCPCRGCHSGCTIPDHPVFGN